MNKRNLSQKTNNQISDGIRKCLDIPNRIGYIITKVRRVDLGREGDIDLFHPPPLHRNYFIMFPETVGKYMKMIKIKSASCYKNVISGNAQTFEKY